LTYIERFGMIVGDRPAPPTDGPSRAMPGVPPPDATPNLPTQLTPLVGCQGEVADPGPVAAAVAQALGVREPGDEPLPDRLAASLRDRRLLLVLDNVEQVVEAAPLVAGRPGACPRPAPLVASQLRLGGPGAHVDRSRRAAVSFSC
jgi:hypothetical protein